MKKLLLLFFLSVLAAPPLQAQKSKPKPVSGIGGYSLGSTYFTKKKKTDDRNIYHVEAKQKKELFDELTIETDRKGVIYFIHAKVSSPDATLAELYKQAVRDLMEQYRFSEEEILESNERSSIFLRDDRMIRVRIFTGEDIPPNALTRIGARVPKHLRIEFEIRNYRENQQKKQPVKRLF